LNEIIALSPQLIHSLVANDAADAESIPNMDRGKVRRTGGRPEQGVGSGAALGFETLGGLDEISDRCGRPLDNNVAERALKRTALLPKNALFYKNEHGALVGAILLTRLGRAV
jgi:hypothetical protein